MFFLCSINPFSTRGRSRERSSNNMGEQENEEMIHMAECAKERAEAEWRGEPWLSIKQRIEERAMKSTRDRPRPSQRGKKGRGNTTTQTIPNASTWDFCFLILHCFFRSTRHHNALRPVLLLAPVTPPLSPLVGARTRWRMACFMLLYCACIAAYRMRCISPSTRPSPTIQRV